MPLPSRLSTYIMTALLVVLIALAAYITRTITSPELQAKVREAKERRAAQAETAH